MTRNSAFYTLAVCLAVLAAGSSLAAATDSLNGFNLQSSKMERDWETKFRASPSPAKAREYMQFLTAHPHHVGSPYDKEIANWLAARFKEWGFDAHIENFQVLFPTPKTMKLEMLEPRRFVARLSEPAVDVDPTSSQPGEQLPAYNAYSIDGDVTGPLVYVNYGMPADYERLDRYGISVKGERRLPSAQRHSARKRDGHPISR